MAEEGRGDGLLEGVLGAEEGSAGAEGLGQSLDPVAAGIAGRLAEGDAALGAEAGAYFRAQRHFVDVQTEHLHEQRQLLLSTMRLRRFTERMKAVVNLAIALFAAGVAVTFVVMLFGALTSRWVVVDAFRAAAPAGAPGVSGEAVAADMLDGLERLQQATRARASGLQAHGAWVTDIKIEVPSTGVSLGELDRLLHAWLSGDVHIGGDAEVFKDGRLVLTVRGDGVPARRFTGTTEDASAVATKAAEYVYGQSQPLRYAIYLRQAGRYGEALAFIPAASLRVPQAERADMVLEWAADDDDLGREDEASAKYRLAQYLARPHSAVWWQAWTGSLAAAATTEEEGWQAAHTILAAVERSGRGERPELRLLAQDYDAVWDFSACLAAHLADAAANGGSGLAQDIAGPDLAYAYLRLHDFDAAERALVQSDPDANFTKALRLWMPGMAALERGDAQAAIPALETNRAFVINVLKYDISTVSFTCYLGEAYSLVGRAADAMRVFDAGAHVSLCAALKGAALARQGDLAGARLVWSAGLAAAPDLPAVYLYRGVDSARRGDLAAAEADLRTAHERAPHWADPLKALGDLVARRGDAAAALAQYDAALVYAPEWGALRAAAKR